MKNPSEILKPEALLAHGTFVRALAGRLVQDAHLAEDITQETWLAAIENSPDEPRYIRAWLHTVARNFARRAQWDAGRRRKREKAAARPEGIRSTLEIVEQENIRRQVVKAVLELTEPYKSAILFRFYDDLPPREIARRQDVPVETVKTRIQRGLEQLRIKLDGEHGGNRKNWCLALAPIAGWKLAASATGAAGGALFVPGITAMTAKMKIAIAVVILLGIAFTFSQILPDNKPHVGHDGDASPVSHPGNAVASSDTDLLTQPQNTNDRIVMQASPTRILGRAVDEGAAPLGGINGLLLGEGGRRISATTTNEAGAFQFEVEPGTKPEAVILEAAGRLPEAWLVPASEEPMIDLGELTLRPAGVLELNLGTADSTLLPPVDIHLLNERDNPVRLKDGLPETVRRALGKVQEVPPFLSLDMPVSLPAGRLAFAVPAGTWRIRVESKENPLLESDPIEIRQDDWTRIFLEFVPTGEITGVCVNPNGLPLSGVKMGAMPVRFEKGPEDYTIVPANQMPGEKGTTIAEKTYVTADQDGLFRFFPIPANTSYDVWCEDPEYMEVEIRPAQPLKEHIFPTGVEGLRFVLRKTPRLTLRVEDEGGMEPGPGPGSVHVAVYYNRGGSSDLFMLKHSTCTLPIPHGMAIARRGGQEQQGKVQVKVFWGRDQFGQTSLDLPWHADLVKATVRLAPCTHHDLGHIPFMASLIHTCWKGLGKSPYESLSFREKPNFPRWNWEKGEGVHFMLRRDDETGDYWITSSGNRLEWVVLWDATFQKIGILAMDTENEIPRVKEKKLFCEAEKIVLRLDEETELASNEEIWCSFEAWYQDICGDRRLAQWGVGFSTTLGKRVLIWPSSPYRYKPAPGATATMWRPKGLYYTMNIFIDDSEYHRTLRRESFVLDGPKFFSIGKDD